VNSFITGIQSTNFFITYAGESFHGRLIQEDRHLATPETSLMLCVTSHR
jgi:hypothetical protein